VKEYLSHDVKMVKECKYSVKTHDVKDDDENSHPLHTHDVKHVVKSHHRSSHRNLNAPSRTPRVEVVRYGKRKTYGALRQAHQEARI